MTQPRSIGQKVLWPHVGQEPTPFWGVNRLIVTEFMSLDGVVEAPGGEPGYVTGWVGELFTDELGDCRVAEQLEADLMILGRSTYESP